MPAAKPPTYYVMAGTTPVLVHNREGGLSQLIGSMRNRVNDAYIGCSVTGRPMEPWRSNRILSRDLAGEPASANATVRVRPLMDVVSLAHRYLLGFPHLDIVRLGLGED